MDKNQTKSTPQLSIVLPSFNGSELAKRHVPLLIDYLNSLKLNFEIIMVDDGSDDAEALAEVCRSLECRFLKNEKNAGKGAAVRKGMLEAKGKYRIYTDIDIPYDFEAIDKMLWYMAFKEYHVVAGDRTLQNSSYFKEVSPLRRVASHLFSNIVGRFVSGGWYDSQCGIKGLRDYVAEDIFGVGKVERFAFDVELLYIALKRNYDIKKIPVTLRCNEPSSTVNVITDGAVMLKDVGKIVLNQYAGKYRPKSEVVRVVDSAPLHRDWSEKKKSDK